MLVCNTHKNNQENLDLLKEFRIEVVQKYTNLENFSKNNSISLLGGISKSPTIAQLNGTCDIGEDTIFQLQTIKFGEKSLNIFFDSGCGEMVIRKSAVELLE